MPEHPVRPPILSKFHRGPLQIAPMRLQLHLELREERLSVRGGASETGQDRPFAHTAQLARSVLDHDVPESDLPVGGQGRPSAAAGRPARSWSGTGTARN